MDRKEEFSEAFEAWAKVWPGAAAYVRGLDEENDGLVKSLFAAYEVCDELAAECTRQFEDGERWKAQREAAIERARTAQATVERVRAELAAHKAMHHDLIYISVVEAALAVCTEREGRLKRNVLLLRGERR